MTERAEEHARDADLIQRVRRAWPATANAPREPALARYRVLSRIGEGGMGVVYEALQRSPRRTVALKVIRPGLTSARAMRRFEFEAEILGRLEHPGIARIFEAGTFVAAQGSQPFFAMELVRGAPLCEHARKAGLRARARVELCIQVCDAIQHAHQRGVVHRDLKPANVLVTDDGRIKVLDFGVAHATDLELQRSTLAEEGRFAGTLPYVSPEQLRDDPDGRDPRSDVYALGVMLFELLAERRPLELQNATVPAAIEAILNETPPWLGSLDPSLRGDLEIITAKALEKDPARRYGSADALAQDLRRFLRSEPIAARPPSAVYRVEKFTRRHGALVGALAGVFCALALGLVGTTLQASRARAAEREAELQRDDALESARLARAVEELLQGVLECADPEQAALRPEFTVREALDATARQLDERVLGEPALEAGVRTTLGNAYRSLGQYDAADGHLRRALDLRRGALAHDDLRIAQSWRALALLERARGDYGAAEACEREALGLCARAGEPARELWAAALLGLAVALTDQGDFDAAEEPMAVALERLIELHGPAHVEVAGALVHFAKLRVVRGDLQEAYALCERARDIYRERLGAEHPYTLQTSLLLAERQSATGELDAAEREMRAALAVAERRLGVEHPMRARITYALGASAERAGRLDEAEALLRQSLELREQVLGDHPLVADSLVRLATVRTRQRHFADAEAALRRALEIRGRFLGEQHPDYAVALYALAACAGGQGHFADAEGLARDALATLLASVDEADTRVAFARKVLANALSAQGKHAQADDLSRAARATLRRAYGDDSPLSIEPRAR